MYLANLLGYAADYHRSLGFPESVVVDIDGSSGDVSSILSIRSSVHVKTMTQRHSKFDVVPGYVTAAGSSGAGDRMAIPVKQIVFYKRRCLVMTDPIS